MLSEYLKKLNDTVDLDKVRESEQRVLAAASYEPVDRLPMTVLHPPKDWPTYTYRESFYDMEKMLANELAPVCAGVQLGDDRICTIRANYGVGTVASMFGCRTEITNDNTLPWSHPLSDEKLDRVLEKDRVDIEAGLGSRVFETIRYYLDTLSKYDKLAQSIRVYICDTQGPFDIAHLVMGHKIYTEIYDNPERVHRLLEMTTDAYIRFTKAQKEILGEGCDWSYHSNLRFRGGVRVCDDAGINISAASYSEFSKPYNEQVLAEFGGGWIHYCGNGKQILPEVISTKGVTGVNFGNPEMQDIASIYAEASKRNIAVLLWRSDLPLPEGVTTGVTLFNYAPDADTARNMLAAN